ncbi:hypothetical protein Tco_0355342 [Tanacetum coccineum]
MLKRCEDTNLVLNWEKSHFMVKEGIVLGHKISKSGIEVDRAKVDVIAKLPHPTTVKDRCLSPVLIRVDSFAPRSLMISYETKKGAAKDHAADHLPDIENPQQDKLETKEITETYLSKLLDRVALRCMIVPQGFADFANNHAGTSLSEGMSSPKEKQFFQRVKHNDLG